MSLVFHQNPTLQNLPFLAIQHILSFLNFKDILVLKNSSKYFHNLCSVELYKCLLRLNITVKKELEEMYHELDISIFNGNKEDPARESDKMLCRYILLDFMNSEMTMLNVICKNLGKNKEFRFPVKILDLFKFLLHSIKSPSLINYSTINKVYKNSSKKISKFINKLHYKKNSLQIGTLLIDLLDIIWNIKYSTCVKYDIKNQVCYIDAEYYLENSKALTLLYVASQFYNCKNYVLNEEEICSTIKLLILFVEIQNHLSLRDKHYRQLITLKTLLACTMQNIDDISLDSADEKDVCQKYCVKKSEYEIIEIYKNIENMENLNNGLKCKIKLECPFSETPIKILKNIKNIFGRKWLDEKEEMQYLNENLNKIYGINLEITADFPRHLSHNEYEKFQAFYEEGVLHTDMFKNMEYIDI